ncbi:MAG: hypothetical protein HWN68_16180 [Desulfobacterales bacterium]|nr:hypothetical protein [Desulfobacterales bacterium]
MNCQTRNILSWLQLLVAGTGKLKMKKLLAVVVSFTFIFAFVRHNVSAAGDTSQKIRPPAVAYMFYPAVPDELRQIVRTFLKDARIAHLYSLTEEEYSLILKETNCADPFRVAALNVYRDIARGKIE